MSATTLVVLLACANLGHAASDPCTQYTVINESRRGATFSNRNQALDQMICDRLLTTGWYRFQDAEMPFDTCVKQYHCGTHVPLWLKGTPPTVQDGEVTRTACGQTHADGDCCSYQQPVGVRNCGQYMVYNLPAVRGCSIGYCTEGYPELTHRPTLSPPIVQEPDFKFICEIPYPASQNDVIFEVTWLADGQPIPGVAKETVGGYLRRAEIYDWQLLGQVNKVLSCSVTTRRAGRGPTSPPSNSSGYWIGVKYNTERVMVDTSHTTETLQLTSTIPVVCNKVGERDCSVDFRLHTDNEHVFTNSCMVQLKPGNWNAGSHVATVSYVITTEPTWAKTSQTTTHVTTTPVSNGTGTIWSSVSITPVQVEKTTDKTGARCSSVGDPHILTFDSKKRYTTMSVGQYTMVKQRRGGSFRVEARTWICNYKTNAACNCAFAMREGNDVITFDMCNGILGQTIAKMEIKNPAMFTNQTKIVKDPSGNKHVLTFRSGAVVTVTQMKKLMNVYINLPASFSSDTEGLCGFFDGNEANDMTRSDGTVNRFNHHVGQFVDSWRIPDGQSLFEVATPIASATSVATERCTCNAVTGHFDCSGNTPRSNHTLQVLCPGCTPVEPHVQISHVYNLNLNVSVSTTPLPVASTTPYLYPQRTTPPLMSTTSTPQVAPANATMTCATALRRDPVLRSCIAHQMTLDYKDVLDMCVMDMELTNDLDMVLSAVTGLMQDCGHQALVNPLSIPTDSVPKVCPLACSLNGNCVDGKCICYSGYESSDCSVKSGQPPTITGIYGGEYCDIETDDCFEPILIGENMNMVGMQCTTTEIEELNGKEYIIQQDITPVDFQSTRHVACRINTPPTGSLKAMQRYVISLSSNGGRTVGNQFNYTVYNPKCLECGKTPTCYILRGTCMINDKCYPQGAEDTEDHTGYCIPARNNANWSPVHQTSAPAATTGAVTPSMVYNFWYYTGASTGCGCFYDPSKSDCACCRNSGCPCPQSHHDRCYDCLHAAMCEGV